LQRVGEGAAAIYGTANPQVLVKHLATLTVCGVFHLKDLHAHLGDATVARGLRDIAQAFLTTGSTAVLSGEGIHLPSELSREAIPFELHLPSRDALQAIVHHTLHALEGTYKHVATTAPQGRQAELEALHAVS